MPTLDNGTKWTGSFTLSKQTGTVITLSTDDNYVDKDIELTIGVQGATTSADTASADVSVQSDSSGRNISDSIGTKASTAPSSGYYLKTESSGSGNSKVTGAGWVDAGSLSTASTTSTQYFPVTSATITQNAPTVDSSGLVTATSTITAGYTPADSKSNTLQLTTQSAHTYTPTTTAQTISSGAYITGTQTILGDANLIAGNIKKDVVLFGVTGTLTQGEGVTVVETIDTHGGTIVTITSGAEIYGEAEEVAF